MISAFPSGGSVTLRMTVEIGRMNLLIVVSFVIFKDVKRFLVFFDLTFCVLGF